MSQRGRPLLPTVLIVACVVASAIALAVGFRAWPGAATQKDVVRTAADSPDPVPPTAGSTSEAAVAEPGARIGELVRAHDRPVVRLEVGDDFAAAVRAHPPGTTYVIAAGLHRGQVVVPDRGDTFLGEPGAVVSGSVVLPTDGFRRIGSVWVLDGRTEWPFTHNGALHGVTEEGASRAASNHDLWWDDVRLDHVETRGSVDASGEWYFDYDADQLVVFDDPSTARDLELAVLEEFISSEASDVTIRNLELERFATPAQHGVIQAEGARWHISDVIVREAHGAGVSLDDRSILERATVIGNGQLGVEATLGTDVVVRDSVIADNGQLDYLWSWERGGLKFKETSGAVVQGNHVHGNRGPGIWFDLGNEDVLIDGNLVEGNTVAGIFYEISFSATISDNVVLDNGREEQLSNLGSGIFVSISSDVLVEGNETAGNHQEIVAVHADRAEEIGPGYAVERLVVRDNHVTLGRDGAVGLWVDTMESVFFSDRGNVFEDNTYVVDGCDRCFQWDNELMDYAAWQAAGNDLAGVLEEER